MSVPPLEPIAAEDSNHSIHGLSRYFALLGLLNILAVVVLFAILTGVYASIGLSRWLNPILPFVLAISVVLLTGTWFAANALWRHFGITRYRWVPLVSACIAMLVIVSSFSAMYVGRGRPPENLPPLGVPGAPEPTPLPVPQPRADTEASVPLSPTFQPSVTAPQLPLQPPIIVPGGDVVQLKFHKMSEFRYVLKDVIRPSSASKDILSGATAPIAARTSAYWNTWFEYQDEPAPAALTVGNAYTFVLDLSPYEYAKLRTSLIQSTGVDPSIDQIISNQNIKLLTFQVRPLLAEGGGLSFGPSVPADTIPLRAEMQRIRNPNAIEAQRYVSGATSLHSFSDAVAAGSLHFEVRTEAPGCSAVVLSILSENGRFPLDHLVRWVAITRPGETPPDCGAQTLGGHQQMSGGLGTLLEVSFEVNSAGTSKLAAAAFHIFDTRAGSFVVFADGRPNRKRSVYAWQMSDSLVSYVGNEHRFPLLINSVRDSAAHGIQGSYVKAAQELAAVLFGGKPGESANEANLAKTVFQEIVEQSSTRPVVVVRVVSDIQQGQNRSLFVPLGILAAKGNGAVLKQPITVMQPLPRERYDSKACVGDWTFGVPNKLQNDSEDLTTLLPSNLSGTWFHDLTGLRSYLADASPVRDQPGQGFLLLAHNGSGNLWFEDEAQRVIQQNITRNYPPGSVGVFAACSVAAASYDSSFVQRFNERGVDALIASPFPVPATYGTRLAMEFPQALDDLRQAGRTTTISDLFAAAIDRTARRLKREFLRNYEEMGLEYVLLGDPNIALCDKSGAGKKP